MRASCKLPVIYIVGLLKQHNYAAYFGLLRVMLKFVINSSCSSLCVCMYSIYIMQPVISSFQDARLFCIKYTCLPKCRNVRLLYVRLCVRLEYTKHVKYCFVIYSRFLVLSLLFCCLSDVARRQNVEQCTRSTGQEASV